jgi:hypothetical protein
MERKIKHVIMFSGGASSSYVAKWVVDKYGKENCILLFTDTLWEDEDNLRFLEECANYIGIEITRKVDGRTPEDVFFEQKFLGNARFAKCSEELKVRQTLIYIEDLRDEGLEPVLYFGIGPHEKHRAESLISHYEHFPLEPVKCEFPMIDSISSDVKAKYIIENEWGIQLPRMYKLGFHHANCSGRCVRGGLHHYANLYLEWPDVFEEQEDMEERFRNTYNLDVSMMKKDGGPYTLKTFRKEVLEKMSHDELVAYAKVRDVDTIPCFCSFS